MTGEAGGLFIEGLGVGAIGGVGGWTRVDELRGSGRGELRCSDRRLETSGEKSPSPSSSFSSSSPEDGSFGS